MADEIPTPTADPIGEALAQHSGRFQSESASEQFRKLVAADLAGVPPVMVGSVVADLLGRPEYAHFLKGERKLPGQQYTGPLTIPAVKRYVDQQRGVGGDLGAHGFGLRPVPTSNR